MAPSARGFATKGPLKLIISGAPASGKGTQCELIVEKYKVTHLSTGDMLRDQVKQGTALGKKANEFMSTGKLVPDELMTTMVNERLQASDCKTNGWMLDGFPRTRAQADSLQKAKIIPDKFILLEVPDAVLIERVVGRRLDPVTGKIYHVKFNPPPADIVSRLIQRSDDTEEKAKVRLDTYHKNLAAIFDVYKNVAFKINGNLDKNKVFTEIVKILEGK